MGVRVSLHAPTFDRVLFDRVDELHLRTGGGEVTPTPRSRPRHYRVISYLVDPVGTIVANLTLRQWVLSAQEAGAPKLATLTLEGKSLYSFFNGALLKAFYRNLIRLIHTRKVESFSFLMYCDSGAARRETVLCARGTPEGYIEFSSFSISQTHHVAPFLESVQLTACPNAVEVCPFCNKFNWHGKFWLRPADFQRSTGWQPGQRVPVTNKVCPKCATVILEPLSPFPKSVTTANDDAPPIAHPFVLFVDDNEYTLCVYEALARACLWVPHTIRDPMAVQHYVQHNVVDVIVVDMVMPAMSGVELLRSLDVLGLLRFPAIGTSATAADKPYMLAAGCVEFLLQPLTRSALRAAVSQALKARSFDSNNDLPGAAR